MNEILKKLGLTRQNPVLILHAPEEYKPVMADIQAEVHTEIKCRYSFIQVFHTSLDEAKKEAAQFMPALEESGHVWLCYPKGASKKYKTDINRTKGWEVFTPFDFEPVSQVALDDDWSAMRFKHVDSIAKMSRKTAATEKGKERIKKAAEDARQ